MPRIRQRSLKQEGIIIISQSKDKKGKKKFYLPYFNKPTKEDLYNILGKFSKGAYVERIISCSTPIKVLGSLNLEFSKQVLNKIRTGFDSPYINKFLYTNYYI